MNNRVKITFIVLAIILVIFGVSECNAQDKCCSDITECSDYIDRGLWTYTMTAKSKWIIIDTILPPVRSRSGWFLNNKLSNIFEYTQRVDLKSIAYQRLKMNRKGILRTQYKIQYYRPRK